MNKKLKIALPIMAGVLAVTTGIGFVAARNNAQTAVTATFADEDGSGYFCGGPGGFGAGVMRMMGIEGQHLKVTVERVAAVIGVSVDDLKAQVKEGKTIADIAESNGVSQATVADTILAPFNETIDVKVKYGYVTADQATKIKEQARQRVDKLLTSDLSEALNRAGNARGFGRGMMGPGHMGPRFWQGQNDGQGQTVPTPTPGAGNYRGMMRGGMMGTW